MNTQSVATLERATGTDATPKHSDPRKGQAPANRAELVLENRRVVGEIIHPGAPRRLVDILNSDDGSFIALANGVIDDLSSPGGRPGRFEMIHVHHDSILFAMPPTTGPRPITSLDRVPKLASLATIVLPGFEVVGTAHLLVDADPVHEPMLPGNRFIPLTGSVVTEMANGRERHDPVVLVNLSRVQVYAAGQRQEEPGPSVEVAAPSSPFSPSMNTNVALGGNLALAESIVTFPPEEPFSGLRCNEKELAACSS